MIRDSGSVMATPISFHVTLPWVLETARRQVSDWWGITKLALSGNKSQRRTESQKRRDT
jgi:hypothetical protein